MQGIIIALFLGGTTGTFVGLEHGFHSVVSLLVGAIVGGLLYKPREVVRHAITSIKTGYKLRAEAASTAKDWFLYAVGVIVMVAFQVVCTALILCAAIVTVVVLLAVAAASGVFYFAALIPDSAYTHNASWGLIFLLVVGSHIWGIKQARKTFKDPLILPMGLMMGMLVGIPVLITLFFTRGIPMAYKGTPVALRIFCLLAATNDRLVVMASAATGTLIGLYFGHVIVGGLCAVTIGLTMVSASKAAVRKFIPKVL